MPSDPPLNDPSRERLSPFVFWGLLVFVSIVMIAGGHSLLGGKFIPSSTVYDTPSCGQAVAAYESRYYDEHGTSPSASEIDTIRSFNNC
jgi:hypothetical protein